MEWYLLAFIITTLARTKIIDKVCSCIFLVFYVTTPYLYEYLQIDYNKIINYATIEWWCLFIITSCILQFRYNRILITYILGASVGFYILVNPNTQLIHHYPLINQILLELHLLLTLRDKYWMIVCVVLYLILKIITGYP